MKPPPMPDYRPPTDSIEVLHRDDSLLVVTKPAGLLSVPGKDPAHADCLLSRLVADDPCVLLVHRLDMDTSGVMVFARSATAQRHLGLQFERRHLRKEYVARVDGVVQEDQGRIDLPLIADWPNRPLQKVCFDTGKHARTDWRVLARGEGSTLLELHPLTGRSHQLRVHCREIGHPIIGDRFYAGPPASRLMLHAARLTLRHPNGGAEVSFSSDVPF